MKDLEKRLRKSIIKIPDKGLDICLAVSGLLILFALFDIETLKKIEIWDVSSIAKTIEGVASPILDIFENSTVKIIIYVLFGILLLLRVCKSVMRPGAMIISHSSFSNTQSTYDGNIIKGYSIKEKKINLFDQMNHNNIVDAIRTQDSLIAEVLNDCDNSIEIFYYGIAHTPLIFRAGFQVGDEGNVCLLHKHRNNQPYFREVSSDPDTYTVHLKYTLTKYTKSSKEMLVVIATSLPVASEDLAVFRGGDICCELHVEMQNKSMYGFDSIASYAVMNRLRKGILDKIRETAIKKNIERIHLVLATSSDFTFFLAQGFSKNHDPEVIAYHYDRSSTVKYPWGISNIKTPANALIRRAINLTSKQS